MPASGRCVSGRFVVALLFALVPGLVLAADPAAAERQYRIARRLAAEGSPDAARELGKVVQLDPEGALADDALVEQALLHDLPRWPEDLGAVAGPALADALGLFDRVLATLPDSDRAVEARYRRALLLLEPSVRHNASAAQVELVTVGTLPDADGWGAAAHYSAAWLAEQTGATGRAAIGYQRLIVDEPESAAALRARVGLGRILLRDGAPGEAAGWLQQAIDGGADETLWATELKESAVRSLLGRVGSAPRPGKLELLAPSAGVRTLAGFATSPGGGIVVADRKEASVLELNSRGELRTRWTLAEPRGVAVDSLGRVFAVDAEDVVRLGRDGSAAAIANQGELAPVQSLAADALGRLWLLGRRGERIGLLRPGATTLDMLWSSDDVRLAGIAWDGRRLVALDPKNDRVLAIGPDGSETILADLALERPSVIAAELSGRIAVLDERAARVQLLDAGGGSEREVDCRAAGVERPAAVGFGGDGSLQLLDASTGAWVRLP